jgi:hypothetical protein
MRSGLWRELNEKAVLSSRKESDARTPIALFDSLMEEMFSLLLFLLVLTSSRSTIEFGNSLGA